MGSTWEDLCPCRRPPTRLFSPPSSSRAQEPTPPALIPRGLPRAPAGQDESEPSLSWSFPTTYDHNLGTPRAPCLQSTSPWTLPGPLAWQSPGHLAEPQLLSTKPVSAQRPHCQGIGATGSHGVLLGESHSVNQPMVIHV